MTWKRLLSELVILRQVGQGGLWAGMMVRRRPKRKKRVRKAMT